MIDVAEALLAAIGVRPIISKAVEKIPMPTFHEAAGMQKTIESLAKDLVRGQLDRSSFKSIDYDRTLKDLSEPPQPDQIEAMLNSFPREFQEYGATFLGQAALAYNYLKTKFPIVVVKTVTESVNLPPSYIAIGNFEDQLEIVDQPLAIFRILAQNSLVSDVALALQKVYPSFFAAIVRALVQAIGNEKLKQGKNWEEPDWSRSLAVLLAVPGVSANLRTQLATPVQDSAPQKQASTNAQPDKLMATESQKLELND